MLAFKKAGGSEPNVATAEGVARLQTFLDDVANLELPDAQHQWYQVEVAAMLDGSEILMHEVQPLTGAALLFMNNGVVLAEHAAAGFDNTLATSCISSWRISEARLRSMPMACFTALNSSQFHPPTSSSAGYECREEHDIPAAQTSTARWMRWLNHV